MQNALVEARGAAFRRIKSLDLCGNALGVTGTLLIAEAVKDHGVHLERLDMSSNRIKDAAGATRGHDEVALMSPSTSGVV